jgi:hypothetical protein
VVYIREAHPADSPRARPDSVKVNDPETAEERRERATRCRDELGLGIPFVVDDMEDSTAKAYAAWPDRLFVVGPDGKVLYRGGPGPGGFRVEEMTAALK